MAYPSAGTSESEADSTTSASRRTARRQLNRVLLVLAGLDLSVLAWVIGVALASRRFHLPAVDLVLLALAGIAAALGVRITLAVRLRRHGGDL